MKGELSRRVGGDEHEGGRRVAGVDRGRWERAFSVIAFAGTFFAFGDSALAQSCPSGSFSCGSSYCTPNGNVCCASVGLPQYYCPSGTQCLSDGSCASQSVADDDDDYSGSSGGGSYYDDCPSGTYACGDSYCTDDDRVCCASVGMPQYSCPSGTQCRSDGSCDSSGGYEDGSGSGEYGSDSSSDGSGSDGSSSAGGSYSGGDSAPSIDGCAAYYDQGYDEYQVEVQCQGAYAYACAGHAEGVAASCSILEAWGYGSEDKCPYCNGVDPRESSGSGSGSSADGGSDSSSVVCSARPASGSSPGVFGVLLSVLAIATIRRRAGR